MYYLPLFTFGNMCVFVQIVTNNSALLSCYKKKIKIYVIMKTFLKI